MEQKARVRKILDNNTAQVVVIRESACSGDCHKCSGCGAAKESILFEAQNPIGACVGDVVTVTSETGPVLQAAAVLYMLPLVLFFGGYALGAALSLSGGLVGSAAFLLSVGLIVVYDRRMAKKDNTVYTIKELAGAAPARSVNKGEDPLG